MIINSLKYCQSIYLLILLSLLLLGNTLLAGRESGWKDFRFEDKVILEHWEKDIPASIYIEPSRAHIDIFSDMLTHGTDEEAEKIAMLLGDWPGELNADLILRAMEHKHQGVRAQAAKSAAELKTFIDQDTTNKLTKKLNTLAKDEHSNVIAQALISLVKLNDHDAIELLSQKTTHQNPAIAEAALTGLKHLANIDAAEAVNKQLNNDDLRIALAATEAAKAIGEKQSLPYILNNLDSPYSVLRSKSASAIGVLQAEDQKEQLILMTRDDSAAVRRNSLLALVNLNVIKDNDDLLKKLIQDPDQTVRKTTLKIVKKYKLSNLLSDTFARLADPNYYVRDTAADTLVTLAELVHDKVIELAGDGLNSQIATVRAKSSRILGMLQSDRNLQKHFALLQDDFAPSRRWAAWALGEIGDPEATHYLYQTAFPEDENTDVETRSLAILSLGKLGYEEMAGRLEQIIPQKPTMTSSGKPTMLRRACVRAIGYMELDNYTNLLLARVRDWDSEMAELEEIIIESVVALARTDATRAAEPLKEILSDIPQGDKLISSFRWAIHQLTEEWPDRELSPGTPSRPDYFVAPLN